MFKAEPNAKKRVALVAKGKADLTSSISGSFPVPRALRPQLRMHPQPWTFYLALNPNKPPFDDVRARQAVNYAVDREKVVELVGGEDAARSTCQVLPPNFPGYRRYCPYAFDPGKAAQLARAPGTAGTKITFWIPREAGRPLAHYLPARLESLGYEVTLRSRFKDFDAYYASFAEGGARPQILWTGWIPDYPAASAFIEPLFTCSSESNYGHFCDHALTRKIEGALERQQDDLVGATRLWAKLDREITKMAAWVSLYNRSGRDLVSKRIGNDQYNPQLPFAALLSQMWVRSVDSGRRTPRFAKPEVRPTG